MTVGDAWEDDESRSSRLVFIGPKGGLDKESMRKKLNALVA
nr:GTP-binding protein [Vibrio genomosp. F10]